LSPDTAAPVGDAVGEILAVADQIEADVIVVARHRDKLPHLLRSIARCLAARLSPVLHLAPGCERLALRA
jgi:hypothetical protein